MERTLESRLRSEAAMANRHASTADAGRAEAEAALLKARAQIQRLHAQVARAHAAQAVQRAAIRHLSEVFKRRFVDAQTGISHREFVLTLGADIKAVLDEVDSDSAPSPEDDAWGTVWLHGDWSWLTKCMTTPEREYAADCVARWSARLAQDDGEPERGEPDGLRWWREEA